MRQPLAAIQALVEVALIEADDPTRARGRLRQIAAESEHLYELASHVLDEKTGADAPVNLVSLAHAAAGTAGRAFGFPEEAVTVAAPGNLVVHADALWIRRAMSNLLDNAMRAAGPHGKVRLSVGRTRDQVEVLVEDSGPGLGNPIGHGFSMGLRLVERTARIHAGHVESGAQHTTGWRPLQDDPSGPWAVDPHAPQRLVVRRPRAPGGGTARNTARQRLQQRRDSRFAASRAAATRRAALDVCVLDISFPDADGLCAVRDFRRVVPEMKKSSCCPVWATVGSSLTLLAAGALGFCRKGERIPQILAAIQRVADGEVVPDASLVRDVAPPSHQYDDDHRLAAFLTDREVEVLGRLAAGESTDKLAVGMGVAKSTVRGHIQSILIKLGVHSRVEAVALANRASLRLPVPSRDAGTAIAGPLQRGPKARARGQ